MKAKEIVSILLSSGSGRAGVVFLATIVLASLFVVVRFPLDFGSQRWNNPAEWSDNPRAVPPAWTSLFQGSDALPHTIFQASQPDADGGLRRSYSFDYQYESSSPPTFSAFSVSDVRFSDRPPVITLNVTRPDDRRITLHQQVVRGPRLGETSPYLRFQDTPLRVFLSGDGDILVRLTSFLREEFALDVSPGDLEGKVEQVVFGTPVPGETLSFEPLPGSYKFDAQAVMGEAGDSVGQVKLVLGGNVFGVMGTDSLGRDLALGLLFGFPVALIIGFVTSVFATAIGSFLGILSGFMGGKTDVAVQRFSDIWSNVPLLPILIFLIFILGQKLWLVVLIMILFGWPGLTIVVRSMVLQIRSGQLVESTRALGASRMRIMLRHILFQIAPFVFAQMIFFTPAAILAEAGLSFLGLGDPSIPTWGQILENGFRTGAVYVGYWWWILPPGLLIVATAMTFVLITLGLEPVVNPRLQTARQS